MSLPVERNPESYEVPMVLVGGHTTDEGTTRLRVDFDLLAPWIAPAPIATGYAGESITADAGTHILQETAFGDLTVRLLATFDGTWGTNVHLDRRTFVEVEGPALPFADLFPSWVRPIHDLMILCLGRQVSVTDVRIELEVVFGPRQFLTLHTQVIQPAPATGSSVPQVRGDTTPTLLKPDDLRLPFSQFVPAWLAARDELIDSVIQLCAPYYASFIYSEHRYGSTFQAADALRRTKASVNVADSDADLVVNALADDAVAKGLAVALAHVVEHEPNLGHALRDDVLPAVHRRPIGERLRG